MRKIIFLISIVTTSVWADAKVEPGTIRSDAELGLIVTSGNTETTSVKVKIDSKHELENWRNQYVFDALYKQDQIDGQEDSQTTAQKFFLSSQANYKLVDENQAIFLFASYEDDRFSGFDYQSTVAMGYNNQWWKDEESSFEYNIGPGYTFNETSTGESDNSFILRAAAAFNWKISDSAKFVQTLSTEVGEDTKTKSESAINAKIIGALQMKIAFIAKHNSGAPEDKEELDTETAVTLVYSF